MTSTQIDGPYTDLVALESAIATAIAIAERARADAGLGRTIIGGGYTRHLRAARAEVESGLRACQMARRFAAMSVTAEPWDDGYAERIALAHATAHLTAAQWAHAAAHLTVARAMLEGGE